MNTGESSESDDDVDLEDLEKDDKKDKQKEQDQQREQEGGRGKFLRYAESISKSSVMRNKHVQKVVTGIAATPLLLTVEIKRVAGSVAVNVPHVPSDRIWIGFRSNPVVEINCRPKVGERAVSLSHVTEWIKRKVLLEFQVVKTGDWPWF